MPTGRHDGADFSRDLNRLTAIMQPYALVSLFHASEVSRHGCTEVNIAHSDGQLHELLLAYIMRVLIKRPNQPNIGTERRRTNQSWGTGSLVWCCWCKTWLPFTQMQQHHHINEPQNHPPHQPQHGTVIKGSTVGGGTGRRGEVAAAMWLTTPSPNFTLRKRKQNAGTKPSKA